MDLTRLVLLLMNRALYFAPLSELDDPYEGYLPRRDTEALSRPLLGDLAFVRQVIEGASQGERSHIEKRLSEFWRAMSFRRTRSGCGVNCWHANDYESEAMWKLYSALGSGVAIESTVGRLKEVLADPGLACLGIEIQQVRYRDFDTAQAAEGSGSFQMYKRPSFEHEQEVRAFLHLPCSGGFEVPCDLGKLIVRVHVSPSAPAIFCSAVQQLCSGLVHAQRFEVSRSRLYEPPDYDLDLSSGLQVEGTDGGA